MFNMKRFVHEIPVESFFVSFKYDARLLLGTECTPVLGSVYLLVGCLSPLYSPVIFKAQRTGNHFIKDFILIILRGCIVTLEATGISFSFILTKGLFLL